MFFSQVEGAWSYGGSSPELRHWLERVFGLHLPFHPYEPCSEIMRDAVTLWYGRGRLFSFAVDISISVKVMPSNIEDLSLAVMGKSQS